MNIHACVVNRAMTVDLNTVKVLDKTKIWQTELNVHDFVMKCGHIIT